MTTAANRKQQGYFDDTYAEEHRRATVVGDTMCTCTGNACWCGGGPGVGEQVPNCGCKPGWGGENCDTATASCDDPLLLLERPLEPPRPRSQSPNGIAGTASYDAAWCARDTISSSAQDVTQDVAQNATQGTADGALAMSTGMIAGIAGGAVVLLLLLLLGCVCCRKKQNKQKKQQKQTAADNIDDEGNSTTMEMDQRGVVLTFGQNGSDCSGTSQRTMPGFDEPSTAQMAGGSRSLQPTVQETTFGSDHDGAGYLDVVNTLVGAGIRGGSSAVSGSTSNQQQPQEARTATAEAPAVKVCVQRTSSGPCTNQAMVGSTRCKAHRCPHPGCSASKSSRAAFCPAHAAPASARAKGAASQTRASTEHGQPSNPFAGAAAATAAATPATKTKSPTKSATLAAEAGVRIAVGAKVTVDGFDCSGTVRYVGPHLADPAKGNRMLVELDEPIGKNNGTIKGVQFCAKLPAKTGVLVKPTKVTVAIKPGPVLNLADAGVENSAYASEEEC